MRNFKNKLMLLYLSLFPLASNAFTLYNQHNAFKVNGGKDALERLVNDYAWVILAGLMFINIGISFISMVVNIFKIAQASQDPNRRKEAIRGLYINLGVIAGTGGIMLFAYIIYSLLF